LSTTSTAHRGPIGRRGARARLDLIVALALTGCVAGTGETAPEGASAEPAPAPASEPVVEEAEAVSELASGPSNQAAAGPGAYPTLYSDPAGVAAEADDDGVHGSVTLRARYRTTDGPADRDLESLISLDWGDDKNGDWSAHAAGSVSKDLDGDSTAPTFSDVDNTYDGGLDNRLYEAYGEYHAAGWQELRIGRQTIWDTPEFVRFDGARVESKAAGDLRWRWGVYAGQTSHTYESSPEGDRVYGALAEARPWTGARARVDVMHLEDEVQLGEQNNDLIGLGLWQNIGQSLQLWSRYNRLEEESRDGEVGATWYDRASDLLLQAIHKELFNAQNLLTEELDPFYTTLVTYEPFRQSRLMATKGFDDDFDLLAGADVRRLKDEDDSGEFNREFERYYLGGTTHDVAGVSGLSIGLTGETWQSDDSDTLSWGLDVTRKFNEVWRLSGGTYYALYKDDFLLDDEREDVRTWYLSVRCRRSSALSWSVGYELEDSGLEDFQTVTAKATWHF